MNITTDPDGKSPWIFLFNGLLLKVLHTNMSFLKTTERKMLESPRDREEIEMVFSKQKVPDLEMKVSGEDAAKTVLLPLLKRFIYILKKSTEKFKFDHLNENAFSLLGDQSHYFLTESSSRVFY